MTEYFALIRTFQHPFEEKKATVYLKDGDYFRETGGLTELWGKCWQRFEADSAAKALILAHESVGTKAPQWKLDELKMWLDNGS